MFPASVAGKMSKKALPPEVIESKQSGRVRAASKFSSTSATAVQMVLKLTGPIQSLVPVNPQSALKYTW